MTDLQKIKRQFEKTEDACNRAGAECGILMNLFLPYICEDIREDCSILEQHGDGLVLAWNGYNYIVEDIIKEIKKGHKDIDFRDIYCPIRSI